MHQMTKKKLLHSGTFALSFVFLLPVFFILHGVSEYLFFIPFQDVLKLLVFYFAITALLLSVFYFVFRNIKKASLAVFVSLAIFFFFGATHDSLKKIAGDTFIIKYSFLLPSFCIIYVLAMLLIKKNICVITPKLIAYLNILLLILILYDASIIGFKVVTNKKGQLDMAQCKTCAKPDVYLIILDGYAGQSQLSADFSYNNKAFLDTLQDLKFYVIPKSKSNYTGTVFSIASLLNFEYLDMNDFSPTDKNLNYCYKKIAQSNAVDFFQRQGYDFVNNSIFDIDNAPSLSKKTFLVSGVDLISSQTLFARVKRDLYNNFLMNHLQGSQQYKDFVFRDFKNNELLYNKLLETVRAPSKNPKFVYTHLMMPHFPYYYKENGTLNELSDLRHDQLSRKDLYLSYLKYCNTRILYLVNHILKASDKEPVILLLSDHGFRYSSNPELYFSNLAAVHFPTGNYSSYYDTITNVNQFRVLFNNLFQQNLSLLKDRSGE